MSGPPLGDIDVSLVPGLLGEDVPLAVGVVERAAAVAGLAVGAHTFAVARGELTAADPGQRNDVQHPTEIPTGRRAVDRPAKVGFRDRQRQALAGEALR
jgi:hypothetical protein